MRTLYGLRVPDSARLVEVRAITSLNGKHRVIFRGPVEEDGIALTEDAIADVIAGDSRFWEWIDAQRRQRRISADNAGDGSLVRLKLSVSFINQDASKAILDESNGATSVVTDDSWEFHRSTAVTQEHLVPMAFMERFFTLMCEQQKDIREQQKELPNQIARILKEVTDTGKAALQTSAAESSKILQASVEPLKAQMTLIEKSHSHESTRADKASDAVIRLLNSETKKESSTVDDLIKLASAAPALLALVEKAKKGMN